MTSSATFGEATMSLELQPIQIRVLGVLIEKSLSQPAYYPMTLNAIKAASNQKTNRDPVTDYSEGEVSDALAFLRKHRLASQADPERHSRAIRFQHEVEPRFGWNAAQRAMMAELMLRGPQTLGELRSRASRMARLESTDYARELLSELERADPPAVTELEREPGRSARRFAQLIGGERVSTGGEASFVPREVAAPFPSATEQTLAGRVEYLEEEVANLRASLASMREILREAGVLRNEI